MRVKVFGADIALAESLAEAGIQVARVSPGSTGGPGATAALAGALRAAEGALADEKPDAVLVGGEGDEALGAALTAVKLEIPTAWLRPADAPRDGLVGRVADLRLDATADAAAVAAAIRELAAPTIPAR